MKFYKTVECMEVRRGLNKMDRKKNKTEEIYKSTEEYTRIGRKEILIQGVFSCLLLMEPMSRWSALLVFLILILHTDAVSPNFSYRRQK